MLSLVEKLAALRIDVEPAFDGHFHRNGSAWFKGKLLAFKDRTVQWAAFGDFARNISETWIGEGGDLSDEDKKILGEAIREASAENRKAREEHWEKTSLEVEKEWASFSTFGESPYLVRKGFPIELFGCRLEAHDRGARTIVPARDVSGKIWGYQRIFSEKLSEAGTDKIFRQGARKEACFHALSKRALDVSYPTLYLCEGIATAASIYTALETHIPVIAVFDAGNLIYVARAIRQHYPETHLVFCADNDQFPSRDGRVYHTGRVKAEKAAKEIGNSHVVLPHFKAADLTHRPTDFNDLHILYGIEEVKLQLTQPVPLEKASEANGLRAVSATCPRTGKPKKPSEKQVAQAFLEYFGDRLIKQGRDLFIYKDGYWHWQDETARDRLKQIIGKLYGNSGAGIRDLENTLRYIQVHAPALPRGVDLFVPPAFACNFQNGTLHVDPKPGGEPELRFTPHRREDYLTTQLPFDFPGLDKISETNPEFEAMLDRIFKGDPDGQAKRRVIAQMYGAVLIPCYSKIFFLVGPKGSGKSTVCKLLHRLASPGNVSHVDPSHFHGFNMETMVGKLLNMVTDIDLHKPIADSIIKQITDRLPFRVPRKFQTDLLAPLPPTHIWGGNDLPKSLEGATGAYERRVIIVQFGQGPEAFSAERLGTGYDLDFDEFVWRSGRDGILAFALRGLVDLIKARGHYAVPESSKKALAEWDERSDVVEQFLDALRHKELDKGSQYFVDSRAEISRKNFWEAFNAWQKNSGHLRNALSAREFCGAVRKKGFAERKSNGEWLWVGVGMAPNSASEV